MPDIILHLLKGKNKYSYRNFLGFQMENQVYKI